MRFLVKDRASPIAAAGTTYVQGAHNDALRDALLDEQRGFCAYTEKRVDPLDTVAVEHFDRTLKGRDDYFNYYATLQTANQRKRRKEEKHKGASFFATRFFQDPASRLRVAYVPGEGVFEETDPDDAEARALVDYLGFNDPALHDFRRRHVAKLRSLFTEAGWDAARQRAWLREHPGECSFVSALEAELELEDLVVHSRNEWRRGG